MSDSRRNPGCCNSLVLSRRLILVPQRSLPRGTQGLSPTTRRSTTGDGDEPAPRDSKHSLNRINLVQSLPKIPPLVEALICHNPSEEGGLSRGTETPENAQPVARTNSFKYCVASTSNPYSLSNVRYAETGEDFYLSSSLGLTRRQKNGGIEFVTQDEHVRQADLYTALKLIPFFRRFPKWRSFVAWRKSTKLRKLGRCKRGLQHELFFLHPTHRSCLLQVRLVCQHIWSLRLFDMESSSNSTGTIAEFCDRQSQQKAGVETKITDHMATVQTLVLNCCRKSLADFLDDCGFGVNSTGGGYTQRAAMRAHCQKLVKFIRLVDFQIAEMYLQVATSSVSEMMNACMEADKILDTKFITQMHHDISAREEAARAAANPNAALASCVALRIFCETKSEIAVANAVADTVISVKQKVKKFVEDEHVSEHIKAPLFRVSLELGHLELMPRPSGPELKANVEHIITDGLGILTSPPRLLCDVEFSPFVTAADEEGSLDQGLELSSILSSDQHFQMMLKCIYACLHNASMYAIAYSRGFDRFIDSLRDHDIFLRWAEVGSAISPLEDTHIESVQIRSSFSGDDEHQTELADKLKLSITELESLLARYVAETAVFAALPEAQCVGVILVDSSSLCSALRPSPIRCLKVTRQYGPNVYNIRTNILLQKLAQQHEALTITPVNVDDYVKLTQTLKIANTVLPTLHDACDLLGTLHSLLIAYGTPIPETTVNCAVLLKNLDTQVRQSLNNADAAVQEGAPQFIEQINVEVGALRAPTLAAKAESLAVLELEFLSQPTQDPADALAHLEQVSLSVANLVARTARVRRYQMALQQDLLDASDLALLVHTLASLKQLWQAAEGWRSQTTMWMEAQCGDLDPVALETVLQAHSKAFQASVDELSSNEAAAAYHAMAEDFCLVIGLIEELKSPSLKNRHWEAIEDILGFPVSAVVLQDGEDHRDPTSPGSSGISHLSVTLGELIEKHAIKASPAIRAITARAAHEAALHQSLQRIRLTWATAEFTVLPHSGRNDVPTLTGLANLMSNVEDDVVTIVRLLESPYVGYIRDELEDWRASLTKLTAQLGGLITIQSSLARLTCQFRGTDSSSVTRAPPSDLSSLIPSAERVLSDAATWWRELMTSFAADARVLRAAGLPSIAENEIKRRCSDLCTALNEIRAHLESRRTAFPRLHLCADETLLAAIARASLGNAVATALPVIRSCFPLVANLELGGIAALKVTKDIVIVSPDGGRLPVSFDFKMRSALEEWLHTLDIAIRCAVAKGVKPSLYAALSFEDMGSLPVLTDEAVSSGTPDNIEASNNSKLWLAQPVQCIIIAARIVWCHSVEIALSTDQRCVEKTLARVVANRQSQYASIATTLQSLSLSKTTRASLSALLIAASHAVDSVCHLAALKASSIVEFSWLATLRYEARYTASDGNATISSIPSGCCRNYPPPVSTAVTPVNTSGLTFSHRNVSMDCATDVNEECEDIVVCLGGISPLQYGFEYVGANHTRLLITPATERCWLSLMTLFQSGFGGYIKSHQANKSSNLSSSASSLAATIGEAFFSVDCAIAAINVSGSLPCMCSRLLRCMALSANVWGCFYGVNLLGCGALDMLCAAVDELLIKAHIVAASCRCSTVSDHANPESITMQFLPRLIVTTTSDTSTESFSRADLALRRGFRPLVAALPDVARTAVLHLIAGGFNMAELLGQRAAVLWSCLPGFAALINHDGCGLGTLQGLTYVLDRLAWYSPNCRIDPEECTNCDPADVPVKTTEGNIAESPAREDENAIDFAKIFRSHLLKIFSRFLDTSAFDALFVEVFPQINKLPRPSVQSPRAGDIEVIWAALTTLAPVQWHDMSHGHPELILHARSLCDTLGDRDCSEDPINYQNIIIGLVGDPGSGKTTIALAAAALMAASNRVEESIRGRIRPLLSIIAVNALPVEDIWGSFLPDGTWSDGAAAAMIRAAVIPGPLIDISVAEAAKNGCIAGARWVLFDFDGTAIDASHLEAICAPFLYVCANEYENSHAIILASGERISLSARTKLIIECDTLAKLAPSAVVRLDVFNVSKNVINWFELGSAWAMTACGDICIHESPEQKIILSALRGRLLDLIQRVFRPMITLLNEIWSQTPTSLALPPTPEVAVRALANHFDALFLNIKSSTALASLFTTAAFTHLKQTASSAIGNCPSADFPQISTTNFDAIVAHLIDPLFVFATAWAIGGRIVNNDLVSTRVDRALRECLVAEDLVESVGFPPYFKKGQATIYEFQPVVQIDQNGQVGETSDLDTPGLQSIVQAEQVGGILPADFNILYADNDASENGGSNTLQGELPLGFDLTFAGSAIQDTKKTAIPVEPGIQTKVNAPLQTNSQEKALIQVQWILWNTSMEIKHQSTKTVLQNNTRRITMEDPAKLFVNTTALYRSSVVITSALCGNGKRKGMGVLVLGPSGSGKTTIAKRALLLSSKSDTSSEEVSLIHGMKLEISMCATCSATWLHASLTAATRGQTTTKRASFSLFIDDISLPVPCTQQRSSKGFGGNPCELIRCLLDHQGAARAPPAACPNTSDPESCMAFAALSWKSLLVSLRVLATARLSLPPLPKRLLRHFWIYELGPLDEMALRGLLTPFANLTLGSSDSAQVSLLVSDAIIDTIMRVTEELPSIPSRQDCAWRGLHDAFRIIRGIAIGMIPDNDRQANSTNLAPLAALFLHECRRVLGDPLRSLHDKVVLEERLASVAAFHFNVGGSAWEAKALFRDTERPLVFADFLSGQTQDRGSFVPADTIANGKPFIPAGTRYEVCRNMTQLRSVLDWHVQLSNEMKQNLAGCTRLLNARTLLAGDGVVRALRTYHALRQQKHVVMIGQPGDQRPGLITLAAHIAGAELVVAQGTNGGNEDDFARNILIALRHAVLMAATARSVSNFPQRTPTKVVILINDESLAASMRDDGSVAISGLALCCSDVLKTSLDVLQATVLNGDVEGKLFSSYSNATILDVESAFRAGTALASAADVGEMDSTDHTSEKIAECPGDVLPAAVRAALAANTFTSLAIAIATKSESPAGLWQCIRIGYPTLAASFQVDYHGIHDNEGDHMTKMTNVLKRRAAEASLDGICSQLALNTGTATSLSCATMAALHACQADSVASPPKHIMQSFLLDIADATPVVASKWYLILKSYRRKLLSAISGYNALTAQLNADLEALKIVPRETTKHSIIHKSPYYTTILCLLAVETANWSTQISAIDKRLQYIYADAILHAIDVRLACGQESLQARVGVCAAAKDILAADNLTATPFTINGATFTYPFEAALHVELADVAIERFVFRTAHAYPGDDALVSTWRAQDCLPRGISAASLALAVTHTIRWPLIIDPNGIGIRWIRAAESSMNLDVHEASPTSGQGVRAALCYSIAQQLPLLLNVDDIPSCCSDTNLFEGSNCTLQKYDSFQINDHFNSPDNSGFRLYCVASNSYPVLTDIAVIAFNVIMFTIDDVGLRSCLGRLAAAMLVPREDFTYSLNSLHQATAGVFVAENKLIDFLGNLNLNTSHEIDGSKSTITSVNSPALEEKGATGNDTGTYAAQITCLVKELDNMLQEASTSIGIHTTILNELRVAFTVGAVGVAAHLATVNASRLTSSFEHCVRLSADIFLSSVIASNACEDAIVSAFIDNATFALSPDAISLFVVELARCFVIQKYLVSVDLDLGKVDNQNAAVCYASSVSKGWQLLLRGAKMGSVCPKALPDFVTHASWDYVGTLERNIPALIGLRTSLVCSTEDFEWQNWFNCAMLDREDASLPRWLETRLANTNDRFLFRALLRHAFLPDPIVDPRRAIQIIFRAARDTLGAIDSDCGLKALLRDAVETGNIEKRTFDKVALAIQNFLATSKHPSGFLTSKNMMKQFFEGRAVFNAPPSILLIGKSSFAHLNRDGVLEFIRSLAVKCGIPRVHVIAHGSGGLPTASVLQILSPSSYRPELSTFFQGQQEIQEILRNARRTGEWVLVYNVENFPWSSIHWLSQLCFDSPSAEISRFYVFFSTNMPCLATKQLQAGTHIKVFRCTLSCDTAQRSFVKMPSDMNRNNNVTYESFCLALKSHKMQRGAMSTGKYLPPDTPPLSIKSIKHLMSLFSTTPGSSQDITPTLVQREDGACDIYRAILLQIPPQLDIAAISAIESTQRRSWRTLALNIEAQRHNAVITMCCKHLNMFLCMSSNHESSSPERLSIEADILAGLTPAPWITASPHFISSLRKDRNNNASHRLQRWLVSLQIHIEYLRSWIFAGHPASIWLGILYSPKLYLQATLLDVVTKLGDPASADILIDSFSFTATPYAADVKTRTHKKHAISGSFYVEALVLTGASWNSVSGVLAAPLLNQDALSCASACNIQGAAPLLLLTPNTLFDLQGGEKPPARPPPQMLSYGAGLGASSIVLYLCPLYTLRDEKLILVLAAHLPSSLKQEQCFEQDVHLLC